MPDMITISETWLSPNVSNSDVFPDSYRIFRKDRSDGYGGVLLECHDTLICREISIDLPTEIVACQLMLANKPSLIICSVYRPPDRDVENIENLCKAFESLCLTYLDIPIWIAGNLNLPNRRLGELLYNS